MNDYTMGKRGSSMGMADILLLIMAAAVACSVIGFAAAANMVAWGVIVAALVVLWIGLCRHWWIRHMRNARKSDSGEADRRYIQAMSLHRHDWINDIQLLATYCKLGKTDKFNETVETIREKAQQESRLFQLGAPGLVLFLYSFPGTYPHVKLSWRIETNFSLDTSPEQRERLTGLIRQLLRRFAEEADRKREHEIRIIMSAGDRREAVIEMTFVGNGMDEQFPADPMAEAFGKILRSGNGRGMKWETEIAKQRVRVALRVPQGGRTIVEV